MGQPFLQASTYSFKQETLSLMFWALHSQNIYFSQLYCCSDSSRDFFSKCAQSFLRNIIKGTLWKLFTSETAWAKVSNRKVENEKGKTPFTSVTWGHGLIRRQWVGADIDLPPNAQSSVYEQELRILWKVSSEHKSAMEQTWRKNSVSAGRNHTLQPPKEDNYITD